MKLATVAESSRRADKSHNERLSYDLDCFSGNTKVQHMCQREDRRVLRTRRQTGWSYAIEEI